MRSKLLRNSFWYLVFIGIWSLSGGVRAEDGGEHPGIHQLDLQQYGSYEPPVFAYPDTIIALKKDLTKQLSHEIFGYLPYWKYDAYPHLRSDLITTIAYFSAELNPNGSIANTHHWPARDLVSWAHARGIRVVLVATLFSRSELEVLLSSASYRNRCVENLLDLVLTATADGINIDFEGVPASQRSNLVLFMQELADAFHGSILNAHISMATPPVDWSNAWDYHQLAEICDALFIMGYNYYWSGSDRTGPVAPLTGETYNISWTVNDYLNKTQSNTARIILGLPYYGIEWFCTGNYPGAQTIGSGQSRVYEMAEQSATIYGKLWHSQSQTPWYRYQQQNWQQGWYDDSLSLALKYTYAKSRNLQGVGMWALGYDGSRSELWGALKDAFTTMGPPPKPADSINFSLLPNYPNPGSRGTIFPFEYFNDNPATGPLSVQLKIYDLRGAQLFSTQIYLAQPGCHQYFWDGQTRSGQPFPAGVYLISIGCDHKETLQKFTILK
jgi:spore germination protein YaaH